MANQITFTQQELGALRSKVGATEAAGKYSEVYREVLRIDDARKAAGQAPNAVNCNITSHHGHSDYSVI